MPTVTLKTAESFTYNGRKFLKGVETNVSPEVAEYLDENEPDQFRVRMNRHVEEVVARPAVSDEDDDAGERRPAFSKMKPRDAIRAAGDYLSPDVESNFEADGRPTVAALSAVLQRSVSEEERDAAFAIDPSRTAHPDAEDAARAAAKKGLTIKRRDPSIEGAVGV